MRRKIYAKSEVFAPLEDKSRFEEVAVGLYIVANSNRCGKNIVFRWRIPPTSSLAPMHAGNIAARSFSSSLFLSRT